MRTLNSKKLISVAVVAALSLSSNAMAKSADVLKLGSSDTALSQKLAVKYKLEDLSDRAFESDSHIRDAVANSKMLHINIADFYGEAPRLNQYIEQAIEQNKLIVLENTHLAGDVFLDALPFVEQADVMLLKPQYFTDSSKVELFGNKTIKTQKIASTEYSGQPGQKAQEIKSPYRYVPPAEVQGPVRLADMKGPELYQALETISFKIDELETVTKDTGGSYGYSCPSSASSDRRCYAALVTTSTYNHVNGDADISISDHYSYAMYRGYNFGTIVAVSPFGSVNPTLKVDNNDKRAYYLESHTVSIQPSNTAGLNIYKRYPVGVSNSSSVAATSGLTYNGSDISYSSSNQVMMSLADWRNNAKTVLGNAVSEMSLYKYQSIGDWVTQPAFKKARLHGVPSISKYGLNYASEGIWNGNKDLTGSFSFTVSSETVNNQIYFTSNSVFSWNASRNGWIHNLTAGSRTLNLGWLKDL